MKWLVLAALLICFAGVAKAQCVTCVPATVIPAPPQTVMVPQVTYQPYQYQHTQVAAPAPWVIHTPIRSWLQRRYIARHTRYQHVYKPAENPAK